MKKLILLVGASGSGKSTLRKKLIAEDPTLQVHSWDELRLEFASVHNEVPDYVKTAFPDAATFDTLDSVQKARIAYDLSVEKSTEFGAFWQKRFTEQLTRGSVMVDNTNTSSKRRAGFITAAKAKGFHVVAYLFPISKKQLIDRANARTDHKVPIGNIITQWKSVQLPTIGEVDEVLFVGPFTS